MYTRDRVFIFCHNFELNGANRFVLDLVSGLRDRYAFELVSPFSGYVQTKASSLGISSHVVPHDEVPTFIRSSLPLTHVRIIVNTLMQSTTVLHLTDFGYDPLWVVHESWGVENLEYTLKHIWSLTSPTAAQIMSAIPRTKHVVFPAKAAQQRYAKSIRGLGRVIYNGLNKENYPRSSSDKSILQLKLKLPESKFILTQVGTVCPRKNQLASVRALNILNQMQPGAYHLVLAGARTFRKHEAIYIKQITDFISENRLDDHVTILPTTELIDEVYQASDLLLCPSLNEALPYVVVEAMYYSLPVVASSVDGIPEAIEDSVNGLLVDPHSPESLASACLQIQKDESLRTRLIENGLRKVDERFSYERMLELYLGMLGLMENSSPIREPNSLSKMRSRLTDVALSRAAFLGGRSIAPKLETLRENQQLINEAKRVQMVDALMRLTSHANQNVPHYRDLFKKIGFEPESLRRDLAYLEKIPMLDRATVQHSPERLIDERLTSEFLKVRHSNSANGSALKSYYSREDLDWAAATNLFLQEQIGRNRTRLQLVVRVGEVSGDGSRLQKIAKDLLLKRSFLKLASYSDTHLNNLKERLKRERPYALNAPPSLLMALIRHCSHVNFSLKSLVTVIESVNESLTTEQFESIARSFGCRVFNRYSLSEAGTVAFGEGPLLKTLGDLAYIELRQLGESPFSELLLTTLHRRSMPLIRYLSGDVAIAQNQEDELEREFLIANDRFELSKHVTPEIQLEIAQKLSEYQISRDASGFLMKALPAHGLKHELPKHLADIQIETVGGYGDFRLSGRGKRFKRFLS